MMLLLIFIFFDYLIQASSLFTIKDFTEFNEYSDHFIVTAGIDLEAEESKSSIQENLNTKERKVTQDIIDSNSNIRRYRQTNADSLAEDYLKQRKNLTFVYGQSSKENTKEVDCSKENGYGPQAIKCVKNGSGQWRGRLLLHLLFAWAAVVAFIMFILWSTKGWCCCCCTCGCCQVSRRITEVQLYVAKNPPGELQVEDEALTYEPTAKEIFYYDKITQALMDI